MKFNIGNRELEFDIRSKEITYKNKTFTPSIRFYGDMKNLYSSDSLDDKEGLYYMYRDVYFSETDENIFKDNNLRYDLTIIIPKIIGNEYNKTFGHYHPLNNDGKRYEEVYEVLSGNAIYIQQNNKEVLYSNAIEGEKILMKEGFGHVTVNPSSSDLLIMANIVDDTFDSEYNDYKDNNGGNYLYTTGEWEINNKYNNSILLKEDEEKFEGIINIYDDFLLSPSTFKFLH